MSNEAKRTGRCLCGAVQFSTTTANKKVGACHCGMCRKWGSGPYMEIDCGTEISFTGEDNIAIYDSSDWAVRGFCRQCGSHLFYRLKEINQHMVGVGLFDNQEGLAFSSQVYIDKKPDFYSFSNDTRNFTEAEILEMYAPPTDD